MTLSSFTNCLYKQAELTQLFQKLTTADMKYQNIISMGRQLDTYPNAHKNPENIVPGCQSIMYLYAYLEEDKIRFLAHSEALISAGLAALLIKVYDGEAPDVILKCPPQFLSDIGIQGSLSPSRSNGLASLFLKMKQEALRLVSKHSI